MLAVFTVSNASNVSNPMMLTVITESNVIKGPEQNYIERVKSLIDLTC